MGKSAATFDREKAQERLSKLTGGVAVFKVSHIYLSILQCHISYVQTSYFLAGWRGKRGRSWRKKR